MAFNYRALFGASQIDTDAAYPQGKARNVSAPGMGDGTPWLANLVNDIIFAPWQMLMKLTGTTPNGSADTANNSQYIDALARWMWGTLTTSNWSQTFPSGTEQYNALAYSPDLGLWVIVGENGVYRTSLDFHSWGAGTIPGNPDLNAVVWSSDLDLFVAVGDGGVVYTNPNPSTTAWTLAHTAGGNLTSVAIKPGTPDTVVAAGNPSTLVYSTNGTLWLNTGDTGFGTGHKFITWAAGLGVFVCTCTDDGDAVATSADGVTWAAATAIGNGMTVRALAWSAFHGRVIAVGDGGDVASTDDLGAAWDAVAGVLGGAQVLAVTVDEQLGQVIAAGADGVAASLDLATWYPRVTVAGANYRGLHYAAARGFAGMVGDGGMAFASGRVRVV